MKILIIDNTLDKDSWGSENLCRMVRVAAQEGVSSATIAVRRAPEGDLPKAVQSFDRFILSGSRTSALDEAPWIDALHAFIRKVIDAKKPFLGVCYGHQTLARALGGIETVRKAAEPEIGWTEIEQTAPSPLFEGVPSRFHTFQTHFDEVWALPPGMKKLAQSKRCQIQACQLESLPIYGIQFHPEKPLEHCIRTLNKVKKQGEGHLLLLPKSSKTLYNPKIGETLFRNFLKL